MDTFGLLILNLVQFAIKYLFKIGSRGSYCNVVQCIQLDFSENCSDMQMTQL